MNTLNQHERETRRFWKFYRKIKHPKLRQLIFYALYKTSSLDTAEETELYNTLCLINLKGGLN